MNSVSNITMDSTKRVENFWDDVNKPIIHNEKTLKKREYARKYYEANKEKIKENQKKYRSAKKQAIVIITSAAKDLKKEKVLLDEATKKNNKLKYRKDYYAKNKDRLNAKKREERRLLKELSLLKNEEKVSEQNTKEDIIAFAYLFAMVCLLVFIHTIY